MDVKTMMMALGRKIREWLELDYMEYSSDANAQAAWVTNAGSGATGGSITTANGKTIHTFTSNGSFVVPSGAIGNVEILVVGGGGGGGGGIYHGGGGGGGGIVYSDSYAVTAGTYAVTIGAGGAGGVNYARGTNGGDTIWGSLTAKGGGGGGSSSGGGTGLSGNDGGCGGGGSGLSTTGTSTPGASNQTSPSGATGYGYGGGTGSKTASGSAPGGGGGGAVGGNNSGETPGNGGDGRQYSISGTATYYAGGGGGSKYSANGGSGGQGGGGAGSVSGGNGVAGTANTGGGGGGAERGGSATGGSGGSGIVIVSYTTGSLTCLQSYSESTIKTQGSYSLKAVAAITDSLNKTLTKTFSPVKDLSGKTQIKYDVRASRTGSNFKIGFHDSGGTTTEHTPNILVAEEWQTETVDISAVSDADKDAIDTAKLTILNADAENVIYIDNVRYS